jgi:hypothetical protein
MNLSATVHPIREDLAQEPAFELTPAALLYLAQASRSGGLRRRRGSRRSV